MKYQNPNIESSYRENDLGKTLYDLVLRLKPKKIIEFGTLYGYSTVAMAMALDELGEGHLFGYDLFDEYAYKHSSIDETQKNIDAHDVSPYVTLKKVNFEEWLQAPESFDLLHIDISNKGDTIERIYAATKSQIESGSTVVFEGGSAERDAVEWMQKYQHKKIADSGVPYEILNADFPSLSTIKI